MTESTGHDGQVDVNPFPATPVAGAYVAEPDALTVETPAIREGLARLDEYLTAPQVEGQPARGSVLAIVGEYGTGKTHLAMRLLGRAREWEAEHRRPVPQMAIEAPSDDFLSLYRERFVTKLNPRDVRDRIETYYADIVAASLEGEDFAPRIRELLRTGRLTPERVVERLGLMETAFLESLQERLRAVTNNNDFATALTLLLRSGFDTAVWEWLRGHPPDPILAERGITKAIDTESAALEAIGVFALIYGSWDRRFILVIDDLERVLSAGNRPTAEAVAGFTKLLEVASRSGTLLVVSGMLDFMNTVGADTLQRIGSVIRAAPLEDADTRAYIDASLARTPAPPTDQPFSPDVIHYITLLAGGNIRKIILLCHHAYRVVAERRAITEAVVREAARQVFEPMTLDSVRTEVRRVLETRGWNYERNAVIGAERPGERPGGPRADFWVDGGAAGARCAVLLTDSLLTAAEAAKVEERAAAIRAADPDARTVLIVNGYLPPQVADRLDDAFSEPPIVYDGYRFAGEFDEVMRRTTRRQRTGDEEDVGGELRAMREHLDQMTQMQASTQNFVERLALYVESLRSSSDRQFRTVQSGLADLALSPGGAPQRGAGEKAAAGLPEVDRLFDRALNGLAGAARVEGLLTAPFDVDVDDYAHSVNLGKSLLYTLQQRDAFDTVGVADLLRVTVTAFRGGFAEWYRGLEPGPDGPRVHDADREHLARLCRAYDALFEYLPVYQIDDLSRHTAHLMESDDLVESAIRSTRRAELREALYGLGTRVQNVALDALADGRTG